MAELLSRERLEQIRGYAWMDEEETDELFQHIDALTRENAELRDRIAAYENEAREWETLRTRFEDMERQNDQLGEVIRELRAEAEQDRGAELSPEQLNALRARPPRVTHYVDIDLPCDE